MRPVDNQTFREDHLASSGTAELAGFGESSLCPGEAQARGFEHGHDKKTSIPKGHHLQYEDLRKLACASRRCQQTAQSARASHTDALPPANAEPQVLSDGDAQPLATNTSSDAIPHDTEQPPETKTTGDVTTLASVEGPLLSAMENYNQRLIGFVTSRQQH